MCQPTSIFNMKQFHRDKSINDKCPVLEHQEDDDEYQGQYLRQHVQPPRWSVKRKFIYGLVALFGLAVLIFMLQNLPNSPHVKQDIIVRTTQPEQIHLSLGANETQAIVTWVTLLPISDSAYVQFGDLKFEAEVTLFEEDSTRFYTYRALLSNLTPNSTYIYKVGRDNSSWSQDYSFRTLPSGSNWKPRFAVFGDLGFQNEESLPYLSKDVLEKDMYDVIFHIGDFAYDLNERDGQQGNDFMNSIEKIAARVPYQTCPGNHERHANFTHYDARFSMLSTSNQDSLPLVKRLNNHFHSLDLGPAHIVLFSTEFYYYTEYGWDQIERQYRFLEEDLKRANANRAERPWIIVMGHRPLYCLKLGDSSCNHFTLERESIRQGIHMKNDATAERKYGLEKLFFNYGVDLQLYGHEHFYGRLLPLYNYSVKSGLNATNPYEEPLGPVHIVTGSAGNREEHPSFNPLILLKEWIAHHQYDYGYTRLIFEDRLHIHLEQISDDKGGEIIDQIDIIKHHDLPAWLRQ